MREKINIDKIVKVVFILYIPVYISSFIAIYFINNGILLLTLMAIEQYLLTIEMSSAPYIKEKKSKSKIRVVILLFCLKYLFLFIRYKQ